MGTMTVAGPIVGGSHGWPFAAAMVDLVSKGYVEEEWFFAGTAPRYRPIGELGASGRWSVEQAGGAPFKTRALVRRPIDADRFNGTVLVEWDNVSAGYEIAEGGEGNVIFEEGFVWVGVTAQTVGIHGFPQNPQGLLAWDQERYGSLHIDDGLSYGVFSEVAKALGERTLGGLEARQAGGDRGFAVGRSPG